MTNEVAHAHTLADAGVELEEAIPPDEQEDGVGDDHGVRGVLQALLDRASVDGHGAGFECCGLESKIRNRHTATASGKAVRESKILGTE